MQHYPEGEIQEMIEIFTKKGMTQEDAEMLMRKYAEYPDLFVEFMMNFELDLQVPNQDDPPWKHGLVTFCSFIFFGLFPLLGYAILYSATCPRPNSGGRGERFPEYDIIFTDPYPLCDDDQQNSQGRCELAEPNTWSDLEFLKDWCDSNTGCAGFTRALNLFLRCRGDFSSL